MAISQPMYLPWPGLFNQILLSDIFIHFDDVDLPQGRSFCSRIQVSLNNQLHWITVPIIRKSRACIKDVLIDNKTDWFSLHLKKIYHSLSKARFYSDVKQILDCYPAGGFRYLSDLNIFYIEKISDYLGLNVKFLKSSLYNTHSKSSEKILELCKICGATKYITGLGAANYLDHRMLECDDIQVYYMNYNILPYLGKNQFTPYRTILDLIAYKGLESIYHLKSTLLNWRDYKCQMI